MKTIIYTLILLISISSFAQDPILQKPDSALDDKAKSLTVEYNKHLALTSDQIGPFEIKVEEFLIRRKKIDKQLQGQDKLKALYALQQQETIEMRNVLTRPQLDIYKKVRSSIQPLDVVPSTGKK